LGKNHPLDAAARTAEGGILVEDRVNKKIMASAIMSIISMVIVTIVLLVRYL
jgi:hypothetical protein